eukprot:5897856-Pleurochrysis_carterae.AAC.1
MKIPLVARPRRQNASARGLALSVPPEAEIFCKRARGHDFCPASRPRLKTRAGALTPCPPRRKALGTLSSAADGEVAKTALISASTLCACSS